MTLSVGDTLPEAEFLRVGADGPESFSLNAALGSGKTVIFGLPGAFTRTCSAAHVPSFIRTKDKLAEKGVDAICCLSVNDPFVMKAWGLETGAEEAGIQMLADASGAFTKAIGMEFSAPPAGLFDRCQRFSMVVENGKVTHLNVEDSPGVCDASAGETVLDQL